jgi:AcrR family transcriptional regulator
VVFLEAKKSDFILTNLFVTMVRKTDQRKVSRIILGRSMDRRRELYEKALQLFTNQGYDLTSMSQLSRAVGISKGGLYHYFESKQHLLFLIHEDYLKKHFVPIIEAAEEIENPQARLSYFITNYTESLTNNPSPRVLIHEAKRLRPEHYQIVAKTWRKGLNLVRNAIAELRTAGKTEKINATFVAFAALGMCSWTCYWFDYSRPDSARELSKTYLNIFLKGLIRERPEA